MGIDNKNNYYDPKLKESRLARHLDNKNYTHIRMDIEDDMNIKKLFQEQKGVSKVLVSGLIKIQLTMYFLGHQLMKVA